jgi:outer membrane protein assembly factor BamB
MISVCLLVGLLIFPSGCFDYGNPLESAVTIKGGIQKGPFILGSSVDAYPVDELGEAISGDSFHTETMSDQGDFKLVIPEPGKVLLEAQGYYYNEVRGALSTSQLTLRALAYVTEAVEQNVYVNLVTHLTRDRIKKLLAQGKELNQAIIQAELELVRNLGLGGSNFSAGATGVHMNLLGGNTLDNAYLFALGSVLTQAAALQGQGDATLSDAHLQELLNQMSKLMENGESFPVELYTLLRQAEATLDAQEVEDAFQARLNALNLEVEVPDLDQILDQDHDGIINNQDNCPHYYNPDQNPDDCACNVCSFGDIKCEQGGLYSCQQIDNCWQWVGPLACSSGQCQDSQSCSCNATCNQEGQLSCYDDILHRCIKDIDGCLTFDTGITCENGCADSQACNTECTTHHHQACFDGNMYWVDSCDNYEEQIGSCECGCANDNQCRQNCACEPTNLQDSYTCHDNAEWWVDDCGIEGEKKIDCECGCNESNSDCKSQQDCGAPGTLKWTFATAGKVQYSPAIAEDGTIYVVTADDKLYAINPDGSLKWVYIDNYYIISSPAIGLDGTIYIGSVVSLWGSDGALYAIDPEDGRLKWEYITDNCGITSTSPSIGLDGTVYLGLNSCEESLETGALDAINPGDGSLKWKHKFSSDVWSPPAIGCDGTIYVRDGQSIFAINPDGSQKWEFETVSHVSYYPAIDTDGTIYFPVYANTLYAVNPDGSQKWVLESTNIGSPSIGTNGTIYVGSSRNLYAINPDGSEKWSFATRGYVAYSTPAIGADGTIYCGSDDNKLYAINPIGSLKWEYETGDSIYSSPAIGTDGTIYVGSDDGRLHAIYGESGGLADSPWPKRFANAQNRGTVTTSCD